MSMNKTQGGNSSGPLMPLTGEQIRQRRLKEQRETGDWTMTPEEVAQGKRSALRFLQTLKDGVRNKIPTP